MAKIPAQYIGTDEVYLEDLTDLRDGRVKPISMTPIITLPTLARDALFSRKTRDLPTNNWRSEATASAAGAQILLQSRRRTL